MGSANIALVGEIGSAIGARMGINKVQVRNITRRNIPEWSAHGGRVRGKQEMRLYYKQCSGLEVDNDQV